MKNFSPSTALENISLFIKETFVKSHKTQAVIAVSGGIDSAVAVSLLVKALGPHAIFPIFLPYGDQDMRDAERIVEWNQIPEKNWREIHIQPAVEALQTLLAEEKKQDAVRLGNMMARVRMIFVFDLAKELDALVCGTENRSEKYLGYFTRFGDSASDLEPITNLYKTQVRLMAQELDLPPVFLKKAPSAGLWADQTDETELGFTYEEADRIMNLAFDHKKSEKEIAAQGLDPEKITKVLARVSAMQFKQEVPYCPEK